MAGNAQEDGAVRVEALAALVRRRPELDGEWRALLEMRLAQTNSPLAKVRAAEVLALSKPPAEAVGSLVAAAEAEPAISAHLVLAAAQKGELSSEVLGPLFGYLTRSVERGWAIAPQHLDSLVQRIPPGSQSLVTPLLQAVRTQSEQQQTLLREYEPRLSGGDAARGRQIFFGKVSCSSCHRVGREGQEVGPDLTKVGAIRTGRDILESVLLPSATFAQGYDTYQAELKDGELVTGVLSRETAQAVILRTSSGAELRLARDAVQSLSKSRLSMMPEGLLQLLSREEVADLLAFLQALK
jgi:putative heme-binding domain-containing protein